MSEREKDEMLGNMSREGRICGEPWPGGKMKTRTQIGTILTTPGGRYSLKIGRV
jgi:hypothetical protein